MARGGKHTADNLRAFMHVRCQAKAKYGVFITNHKVTARKQRALFAEAGYSKEGADTFPHMQFWSIDEYFAGTQPNLPTLAEPESGLAVHRQLLL